MKNVENFYLEKKGYIPETYIQKEERLNIYKRFAMTWKIWRIKWDEKWNRRQDLEKYQIQWKNFILSIELKLFAEQNHIQRIDENSDYYELYFLKNIPEEKINKLSENLDWKDISNREKNWRIYCKKIEKK